jgi:hypothetical protein
MVVVPASAVAHGRTDGFRHIVEMANQLFDTLSGKIRIAHDRLVQVRHIGLVMPVVMNLHRLRVDVRLQRVERVRERGQFKRPGGRSGWLRLHRIGNRGRREQRRGQGRFFHSIASSHHGKPFG